MTFNQQYFQENELVIKDKHLKYYLSPILVKNNFKHGFFTKTSSEIKLSLLSRHINKNYSNCVLNQIHSNKIVFGSKTKVNERVKADGLVNDKRNQNLWIYTADCMPILFADKKKDWLLQYIAGERG